MPKPHACHFCGEPATLGRYYFYDGVGVTVKRLYICQECFFQGQPDASPAHAKALVRRLAEQKKANEFLQHS